MDTAPEAPSPPDAYLVKLQSTCVPALKDGLDDAKKWLGRPPHRLKHRDQRIGVGPLLNAVVAYYLSRPADEQHRIAAEGIRLYEAMEARAAAPPALDAVKSVGPEGREVSPGTPKRRRGGDAR